MLLVYTHKITPRFTYIFDLIVGRDLGLEYRATTSRDEFAACDGPRLNYSFEPFDGVLRVQPSLMLTQEDVAPSEIEVVEHNGSSVFFFSGKGDIPFDLFGASFYLLTRYEEYLDSKLDRFGRYDPRNSLAWKRGFLYEPVVNIWIGWLRDALQRRYPGLELRRPAYRFIPTIDVDNAYAYLHKGFVRQVGGMARALSKADLPDFSRRLMVLLGKRPDPYDTYNILHHIHHRFGVKPKFFFLLANYGGLDKAVPINSHHFQELILSLAQHFEVGIHPSFSSFFDFGVLENETLTMADLTGHEVQNSRFHFVKFGLPASYQNLIKLGIKNDYSMGYPSRIGFRCGYAGEFPFFDLRLNQATDLVVHPFQVMDASLNLYMKLSPDEAVFQARSIIDKIKAVGGDFTMVWHNESLGNLNGWEGWSTVYEQIVRYAVE